MDENLSKVESPVVQTALGTLLKARTALVNGFMLLIGAIWGERAALKQPGKDL